MKLLKAYEKLNFSVSDSLMDHEINNLRNILIKIKFPKASLLNYKQVFSSNLDSFIKVFEYLFKSYNTKIIQDIKSAGYRVQGLTGQAFLDEVFKIGRVFFNIQLNLTMLNLKKIVEVTFNLAIAGLTNWSQSLIFFNFTMTQFLNAKKFIQQRILLTTSFCLEFYKRSPKKLPSYFDKKPPIKTVHHISKKINQATATMCKTEEIQPSFEVKCVKNSEENELTDCYENMLLRLSNLEIKMLKNKGLDMESYGLIMQRIGKIEESLASGDSSQNFNFSAAELQSLSNRINSLPLI